jgi:hypothetical protein
VPLESRIMARGRCGSIGDRARHLVVLVLRGAMLRKPGSYASYAQTGGVAGFPNSVSVRLDERGINE